VKDTGKGIDHEIFQCYSKFATTTTTTTYKCSDEGIGVGLFVSKAIVEAHCGWIWDENNNNTSDSKNAGTRFSVPLTTDKYCSGY
jgi:K+-sensing histidine kinase KdpD